MAMGRTGVGVPAAAAVVSLVSREEAGDPAASPCARGRLFEGETHAAGRTRAKGAPRNERGAR